jgi:hypothetical protein
MGPVGTGVKLQGCQVTTRLQLVPRPRKRGTIQLFPMSFIAYCLIGQTQKQLDLYLLTRNYAALPCELKLILSMLLTFHHTADGKYQ